ncbi:hypothetical protein FLX56_27975 [Synechococcus moorigangaii CMS01]|nr:hypothetical protein [Synechococcus moorigangaii CMS01]
MPRGGKREGAGAKPKWKHGKTTVIRVPEALADNILDYANRLDKGLVTKSKTIDLSGVTIPTLRHKKFVFLQDLVRLGYEIYPLDIASKIREELKLSRRS